MVVQDDLGAEPPHQIEVAPGRSRNDVVPSGHGKLDGGSADARTGAPHEQGLPVLLGGRHARGVEPQQRGREQARGGGGDGQGQHDAGLVGDGVRERGHAGLWGDDELLVGGPVDVEAREELRVRDDALALGEGGHAVADREDLAGEIQAQDRGPRLDEHAAALDLPVDGVDGHGGGLDEELARAGFRGIGGSDS